MLVKGLPIEKFGKKNKNNFFLKNRKGKLMRNFLIYN